MPTVLKIYGLRFFFFSNESQETSHIQIEKNNAYAKYNLAPIEHVNSVAFTAKDLTQIRTLIEQHQTLFLAKRDELYSSKN